MGKWEMVRLGDVAIIQSGGTPARSHMEFWNDGNIPWVKISDIRRHYISRTEEYITEQGLANSSAKLFPVGTILYSIFATLGEVSILNIEAATNQAIAGITISDMRIDSNFLVFYLKSIKKTILYIGRGVAQNNINLSILKNQLIPLPPLDVQQKIADVLDKASALIELRKAQLEKLDLLIKSQFIEMFGDPVTNPKGWEISNINSICNVIVDCPHSTPYYLQEDTGYMCIRTSVLKNNRIDWNRVEYISSEQFVERTKRYVPKENDIVYSREGAILGIAAVIDRNVNIALGQRMMLFSINVQKCHCYYLWFVLNQNAVTRQVQDKIGGSASPHINVKDIKTFEIPVPPIKLQNEFAAFVECVENQKKILQQSLEKLELNYKSLMQKCFRGEIF